MIDILGQEEFKNSTKSTIVLLNMISHLFLTSEGLESHVEDIARVLTHYETVFYDNDDGLQAICSIAEVLTTRLTKFDNSKVVSILFSIILNIQATKTLSENIHSRATSMMSMLAIKSGFNNVAELHGNEV